MVLNHIILAMLWVSYCVLHSVLASPWWKRKLRSTMKDDRWYRVWYTLFAFAGMMAVLAYQFALPTIRMFTVNYWLTGVGLLLGFSGLVLMLICIRKYFLGLSGLRSLFVEHYSDQLQITGVHKYVRHPLYLGTFAFIWGLFLLFPLLSLLIANIIITSYTLIGIGLEEQKLIAGFGDSYEEYRKNVPKLIPFRRSKRGL